jgi:hypothetical protein
VDDLILRLDVSGRPVSPGDALTRWLRTIPLGLLAGLATLAAGVLALVAGVTVVVTGRRPGRILRFQVWAVRLRLRTFTYLFLLQPNRPPVPARGLADDGADRATEVTVTPSPTLARWSPPARLLAMAPSIVIGVPVGLVVDLLYPVLAVVTAVRRGVPPRLAAFLADLEIWVAHVFLYLFLATDVLPPIAPRQRGVLEPDRVVEPPLL